MNTNLNPSYVAALYAVIQTMTLLICTKDKTLAQQASQSMFKALDNLKRFH